MKIKKKKSRVLVNKYEEIFNPYDLNQVALLKKNKKAYELKELSN